MDKIIGDINYNHKEIKKEFYSTLEKGKINVYMIKEFRHHC